MTLRKYSGVISSSMLADLEYAFQSTNSYTFFSTSTSKDFEMGGIVYKHGKQGEAIMMTRIFPYFFKLVRDSNMDDGTWHVYVL